MSWRIKFNAPFFITLIFVLLIVFISLMFYKTEISTSNIFQAQKGSLRIPYEDFQDNIILNGEWLFYNEELITASELNRSSTIVTFPHVSEQSNYGTYALEIKGLTVGKNYGLYIPDNASAFALYLENLYLTGSGQVAGNKIDEKMSWEPKIITFVAPSDTVTIYYQLSAFHNFPSGFVRPLLLGESENIIQTFNRKILAQMVLFGAISIMGLYNLSLFLLNTKELAALFFALFNLAVATRILITGERVINTFVKNINWEITFNIQFISGAMMLAFFSVFICFLFKELCHKLFLKGIIAFSAFMILSVFLFPKSVLSVLDIVFLVVTIMTFIYILLGQIKLIRKGIVGSNFAFIGSVFIIGTIIMDAILPSGTNIIPIGIFIFQIFYSLVISEKYTFLFEQNIILNQAAIRDSMTNLYKKHYFRNLIEKIISKSSDDDIFAMMFIDIDDFKSINDNYGHDIGDEVIINIAQRIIQSLSYSDIACRFGGDEFVVWLQGTKEKETEVIADRILKNIMKPITVEEFEISISVSIGISIYGSAINSFDAMIVESDRRMYLAKADGKNRYRIRD